MTPEHSQAIEDGGVKIPEAVMYLIWRTDNPLGLDVEQIDAWTSGEVFKLDNNQLDTLRGLIREYWQRAEHIEPPQEQGEGGKEAE